MDFVLTSDLDWASEHCVEDLLYIAERFSLKPTFFVTHESAALRAASRTGRIELGIHPNFLPDSDHGDNDSAVIKNVLRMAPHAMAVRSHRYINRPEIAVLLAAHGLKVDSNVCRHLIPGLSPEILPNGLLQLPVFFEDDVHWSYGLEWKFEKFQREFFGPGLKILNFHPFFVSLNVPDAEFYRQHKHHIRTLTREQATRLRHRGTGTRTFLLEAIKMILARGGRFRWLSELAAQFANESEISIRTPLLQATAGVAE